MLTTSTIHTNFPFLAADFNQWRGTLFQGSLILGPIKPQRWLENLLIFILTKYDRLYRHSRDTAFTSSQHFAWFWCPYLLIHSFLFIIYYFFSNYTNTKPNINLKTPTGNMTNNQESTTKSSSQPRLSKKEKKQVKENQIHAQKKLCKTRSEQQKQTAPNLTGTRQIWKSLKSICKQRRKLLFCTKSKNQILP